jgi:hypothetical protein
MLFNDLLHYCKSEAGALGLAGHIGVEDPSEQLALEPGAIVTHGDDRISSIAAAL